MNPLECMFNSMPGWTTRFEIDGVFYGGHMELSRDSRVLWQLEVLGGAKGKSILELGPLEGGHTKMFLEAGASKVISVEGNPNCWLRCLIVQQVFRLKASFVLGDFCKYVAHYSGDIFDIASAAGVLYHQNNPAELIHGLARIAKSVMVWSQVASNRQPGGPEISVEHEGTRYRGRINDYGADRKSDFCGRLRQQSVWLYPEDMRQCFKDAGFVLTEKLSPPTEHGESLLFVATRT